MLWAYCNHYFRNSFISDITLIHGLQVSSFCGFNLVLMHSQLGRTNLQLPAAVVGYRSSAFTDAGRSLVIVVVL